MRYDTVELSKKLFMKLNNFIKVPIDARRFNERLGMEAMRVT
jgi:hypothetical protein